MTPRLPDFFIVGAMRSGTTSLHEWLAAQPELWMLPSKEAHFFSQPWVWERGLDWYRSLFSAAPPGAQVGESSTSYSDPGYHADAAARMIAAVPGARLIFVVRHPLERLRSDLEHEIRQGRESRPAEVAIADPTTGSVLRSCYFKSLEPFLDHYGDRLLVVRFEDLVEPGGSAWTAVLRHLGLPGRPSPATAHNIGRDLPDAAPLMRWLRARSWGWRVTRLPKPLKRVGKRLAARLFGPREAADRDRFEVPGPIAAMVWEDVARLERHLGRDVPLWPR